MGIISQLRSLRTSPPPGERPSPPLPPKSSPQSSRPQLIRQGSSPSPSPHQSPFKRPVRITEISQPTLLFTPHYTAPAPETTPRPLYPEHRNKLHKAKSAGVLKNSLPRTPPDQGMENVKVGWKGRARSAENDGREKPLTSIPDTPPRLPPLGIRKSPSTPLIRRKPPPTLSPEENKLMGRDSREKRRGLVRVEECDGSEEDDCESQGGERTGEGYSRAFGERLVKRGLTVPPPLLEVSTPLGTTFCLNSPNEPVIVRLSRSPPCGRTHLLPPSASAPPAFPTSPHSASKRPLPPIPSLPSDNDTLSERRKVEVVQRRRGWEPPQKWDEKVFVPPPEPVPAPSYLRPLKLTGGPRPRKVHSRTVSG
ncbi:hypothetical protein IAR50_001870 [Cryptococcus sp. DSM 104548]